MGRKHCRKRRNCSLRAISPLPTVFSKELYCRHVKTRACLGKVQKGQKTLWKKEKKYWLPACTLFPKMFSKVYFFKIVTKSLVKVKWFEEKRKKFPILILYNPKSISIWNNRKKISFFIYCSVLFCTVL